MTDAKGSVWDYSVLSKVQYREPINLVFSRRIGSFFYHFIHAFTVIYSLSFPDVKGSKQSSNKGECKKQDIWMHISS